MNISPLTSWVTYRFRYICAYALLAIVTGLLFWWQNDAIPTGLSPSEAQSVIASSRLQFTQLPHDIIDLPYHALQHATVALFGMSPLGVRLPSLLFGIFTALCMALMLRRWFQPHIAFIAATIIITSAWLVSLSRLGAPFIMVPFWTSVIMLCATHVSQQGKGWRAWKVLLALACALSFYTPFMIYLFAAVFIAACIQPHLRYLLRESGALAVTVGFLGFVILLVPLGWGVYQNPHTLRELAAIPAQLPGPMQFFGGLIDVASNVANPFNVQFGEFIAPAMSLAAAILFIMGAIRLLTDFHSVRAYVLLIWGAILVPVIGLNPSYTHVLFVPAMLISAIGLHLVVGYWYRLFPRNPYARIFGLIPIAILVLGIIQFNYQRYFYGMFYSEQAGQTFVADAFMAQKYIKNLPAESKPIIVVGESAKPLYEAMIPHNPRLKVVNGTEAVSENGTWIIAPEERGKLPVVFGANPHALLVNDHKNDSLRFWVYQK